MPFYETISPLPHTQYFFDKKCSPFLESKNQYKAIDIYSIPEKYCGENRFFPLPLLAFAPSLSLSLSVIVHASIKFKRIVNRYQLFLLSLHWRFPYKCFFPYDLAGLICWSIELPKFLSIEYSVISVWQWYGCNKIVFPGSLI